jgi:membrane protease YdiL (CAAX protease family)
MMQRSRVVNTLSIPVLVAVILAGNIYGAALVLIWVAASRTPWSEIGFTRWPRWRREALLALIGGALLKILQKAVVVPLFGLPPMNAAYHFLVGNTAALEQLLVIIVIGAGFGEELIWRGFLFERLTALLGRKPWASAAMVAGGAFLFGLAHLHDQGWPGVVQSTIVGLVLGTVYARLKRIWPIMIAHAAFDVTAAFMVYLNREEWFARLLWH